MRPTRDSSWAAVAIVAIGFAISGPGTVHRLWTQATFAADPPATSTLGMARAGYELVDVWSRAYAYVSPYTSLGWPANNVPGGIGLDEARQRVYVTDRSANIVWVFDPQTGPLASLGAGANLSEPRDVAVLPDGSLAVSDTGNDRVVLLDVEADSVIATWPVSEPRGIQMVGGWVYVVSRGDRAIHAYDTSGILRRRTPLPARMTAADTMTFLSEVFDRDVDPPYIRVLVSDPVIGQVVRIQEGQPPTDRIEYPYPGVLVAENRSGVSYAATTSEVIAVFGPDNLRVAPISYRGISDLAIADSALYVATESHGLLRFDDSDDVLRRDDVLARIPGPQVFHRIATGPEVVTVEGREHTGGYFHLGRRDSDGRWLGRLSAQDFDSAEVPVFDAYAPRDLALEEGGPRLLDHFGQLVTLGASGASLQPLPPPVGRRWPLAVDGTLDEHVVWDAAAQQLLWFGRERGLSAIADLAGGFNASRDVALAGDTVVLANPAERRVESYTRTGERIDTAEVSDVPWRVAQGPDGKVFSLSRSGWIHVYDSELNQLGAWAAGSGSNGPRDLAVTPDGRILVADFDVGDSVGPLDDVGAIYVYAQSGDPDPRGGAETVVGDCTVLTQKSARPSQIVLGDAVEIELAVSGRCQGSRKPVDVVLVIDRSASMGGHLVAAQDAAIMLLGTVAMPGSSAGLVTFSHDVTVDEDSTADFKRVAMAVAAMTTDGGTNIYDAVREAGRIAASGPDSHIILLSDGTHTAGDSTLDDLDAYVADIEARGIKVHTIGLGFADSELLRRIASSDEHYHSAYVGEELFPIFERIGRDIEVSEAFDTLSVVDRLPTNMSYIVGSGDPVEPEYDSQARTLTWRLERPDLPGPRLRFRVRPLDAGRWPTNAEARAYVELRGERADVVFDVPEVDVYVPTPVPSPTPRPWPTHLVTAGTPPTVGPTATVSSTGHIHGDRDRIAIGHRSAQ